jgi:hypothetical protein
MTTTAAVSLQQPPTAADIDRLATQFLELESKADEAYKIGLPASAEVSVMNRMRKNPVAAITEMLLIRS